VDQVGWEAASKLDSQASPRARFWAFWAAVLCYRPSSPLRRRKPIATGGVSLGATIGVSKVGACRRGLQYEAAKRHRRHVRGGTGGCRGRRRGKIEELKNSKGAVLKIKGAQAGLEAALDFGGMEISLKKLGCTGIPQVGPPLASLSDN